MSATASLVVAVALYVTFRWHDSVDAIAPVMHMHSNGHACKSRFVKAHHFCVSVHCALFVASCILLFVWLLSFRARPML